MLIKDLKPNTNANIKVKLGKIIDDKEIENKEGKRIKVMTMELEDEENNTIEADFYGLENCERVDNNIDKWVMLYKFWVKEFEGVKKLSSARYGYLKPIEGIQ